MSLSYPSHALSSDQSKFYYSQIPGLIGHNIGGIFHRMISPDIALPFDGRFLSYNESTNLIIVLIMVFNDALSSNRIIFSR